MLEKVHSDFKALSRVKDGVLIDANKRSIFIYPSQRLRQPWAVNYSRDSTGATRVV